MTNIGFITPNKVLAQSLSTAIAARPELGFQSYILLDPRQATLDVEVLSINVALVDMLDGTGSELQQTLSFCRQLRQTAPGCRVLLLLSPEDRQGKAMAVDLVQNGLAADFVFYDTSLEYLFAKLSAF